MAKKAKLKRIREAEGTINRNLYRICGSITIIVMVMMTIGFFSRGTFPSPKIGVFYLGVLIIYRSRARRPPVLTGMNYFFVIS